MKISIIKLFMRWLYNLFSFRVAGAAVFLRVSGMSLDIWAPSSITSKTLTFFGRRLYLCLAIGDDDSTVTMALRWCRRRHLNGSVVAAAANGKRVHVPQTHSLGMVNGFVGELLLVCGEQEIGGRMDGWIIIIIKIIIMGVFLAAVPIKLDQNACVWV